MRERERTKEESVVAITIRRGKVFSCLVGEKRKSFIKKKSKKESSKSENVKQVSSKYALRGMVSNSVVLY